MSSTYKCKSFGNSCILSVNFLKYKLGNPPSVYKIYENLGSLIIIYFLLSFRPSTKLTCMDLAGLQHGRLEELEEVEPPRDHVLAP